MHQLLKTFAFPAFIAISLMGCAHSEKMENNVTHPDAARFGYSVEAMTDVFDEVCTLYEVRELDVASLPIAETSHTQVDCQGFYHAGHERLAEFVFADDRLVFIWVLTTADEEPALLEKLLSTYGTPTHNTALFIAFADDFMALRRDIPELLYYSEDVAPVYRAWFDQAAASE